MSVVASLRQLGSALSAAGTRPRRPNPARWTLWRAPPALICWMVLVEAATVAVAVLAWTDLNATDHSWAAVGIMAVTALGFEEGSRRVARLKIRLASPLRVDMSSVWAVAAAIALPPGLAAALLITLYGYDWFRQFRPAGEALHRKLFVAATAVLACVLAGDAVRLLDSEIPKLPWALNSLIAICAGIAVFTVANRALVTVVLLIDGQRLRALLGTADDNLIELATLCLGGLVSLAILYQPWTALLVVAPMFTLQRGALMRDLEAAAAMDAKTGLLNAIAWEHLTERELSRAQREGYPLAVLIVDIDRFKSVNDRFGHLVGDQVLRRIGRAIATELRGYDGVARFGGEEFVAVLPDVGAAAALTIADRVRQRISTLCVSDLAEGVAPSGDDHPLSVSIGVSSTSSGPHEVGTLLRVADAALYEAKAGGRNRVVLGDTTGGSATQLVC